MIASPDAEGCPGNKRRYPNTHDEAQRVFPGNMVEPAARLIPGASHGSTHLAIGVLNAGA
jgi:hypothetical protein